MSQFYDEKLKAADKIVKAKICLQQRSPFFSYIALHLKFIPDNKLETMGVDPAGNVFYNEKFVESMNDDQTIGTICHELLHVVLHHCTRRGKRDPTIYNISIDAKVNQICIENGFKLPEGVILPHNNEVFIKQLGKGVTDIDKKTSEQIYDELFEEGEEGGNGGDGKGEAEEDDNEDDEGDGSSGQGKGQPKPQKKKPKPDYKFDEHLEKPQGKNENAPDMENGKNEPQISENEPEEKWDRILDEAAQMAQMRGEKPRGIERIVDKMLNPKMSWHQIVAREMSKELPIRTDWSRMSKRSQALGIYLPSKKKENINLAIGIDSSGSITKTELEVFKSKVWEIVSGLANVRLSVLICDSKIHKVYEFDNANLNDIKKIRLFGGGGTSTKPIFDFMIKNKPDVKLLIYLTDGEVDEGVRQNKYRGRIIWVLTKNGTENLVKGTGRIIRLNE
jgi:predicted metal-dependent peptidase